MILIRIHCYSITPLHDEKIPTSLELHFSTRVFTCTFITEVRSGNNHKARDKNLVHSWSRTTRRGRL